MKKAFLLWTFLLMSMEVWPQGIADLGKDTLVKHFTKTEFLVGPSIISIRDSRLNQYQRNVVDFGYAIGLGKAYSISNHIQLTGRLFYERKGGKHLDAEQVANVIYNDAVTVKNIYTCITIPVTVGYSFGKKIHYRLEGGAFVGYTLKAVIDASSSVSNYKVYNDITTQTKPLDYGFVASIGIQIPLDKSHDLSIHLLNNWGLPNVLNITTDTWRTTSLVLLVGYPINIF